VKTITGVQYPQFGACEGHLDSHQEQAIQLDATTRTAWTHAFGGSQIQQFSY
jgi:hypothetical protein